MGRRSKGEGSIFKRKDGYWTAQLGLPNGKRKAKYCKTQKEARDWLREQNQAVIDGVWVEKDNMPLSDYLARYITDIGNHTLCPKTLEGYCYLIRKHIVPEIGQMKLVQLRPDHLQALYSKKLDEGLSTRTVYYIHALLHKTLGQALKWGLVSRNVADLAEPPSVKKKSPVILTVEQAKQLLEQCVGTRYYYIYLIAISCGLREGEILGLYPSDIKDGIIHVSRAVQFLPGKGLVVTEPKTKNAIRPVKLPSSVVPIIQDYLNRLRPDQTFLFSTANNTPISPRNLLRHFHQRLELMGLPKIPFHSLRHLHASILLLANVHPKTVQGRLGHSTVLLTLDTYSHLMPGMDEDAAEKISGMF